MTWHVFIENQLTNQKNQIKSNQFYLSSIAWGVVAQSPEPRAHVLNARAFRTELEFRNVGFCGEGKTRVPREKPLGAEKRTNNNLQPTYHVESGNRTWATLVEGECSHHCAIPAPPNQNFSSQFAAKGHILFSHFQLVLAFL